MPATTLLSYSQVQEPPFWCSAACKAVLPEKLPLLVDARLLSMRTLKAVGVGSTLGVTINSTGPSGGTVASRLPLTLTNCGASSPVGLLKLGRTLLKRPVASSRTQSASTSGVVNAPPRWVVTTAASKQPSGCLLRVNRVTTTVLSKQPSTSLLDTKISCSQFRLSSMVTHAVSKQPPRSSLSMTAAASEPISALPGLRMQCLQSSGITSYNCFLLLPHLFCPWLFRTWKVQAYHPVLIL